jgi:hypothetical protein
MIADHAISGAFGERTLHVVFCVCLCVVMRTLKGTATEFSSFVPRFRILNEFNAQ